MELGKEQGYDTHTNTMEFVGYKYIPHVHAGYILSVCIPTYGDTPYEFLTLAMYN